MDTDIQIPRPFTHTIDLCCRVELSASIKGEWSPGEYNLIG